MTDPVQLPRREGQEGNRWVNHRPSGEEVAAWFEANVQLHEGMKHEDFVTGVTLIQQSEKVDEVIGLDDQNRPLIIPEVQHLYFIPYPKVETRIDYFNRLPLESNVGAEEEWSCFLLPDAAADPKGMHVGFSAIKAALPDSQTATLVTYSVRAVIIRGKVEWVEQQDADGVRRRYPTGDFVAYGNPGTKSVPLLDRYHKPDPNALAKAQTGAVGRALGMIGILVIPGTGVATAEDMQDLQAPAAATAPTVPPTVRPSVAAAGDAETDDALRRRAAALLKTLEDDHPAALEEFRAWARERNLKALKDTTGAPLKGVVKKAEKLLEAATKESPTPVADFDISGNDEKDEGSL
jgi:hypothetical protein